MTRRAFILGVLGVAVARKCERKEPPRILTPREPEPLRGLQAQLVILNEGVETLAEIQKRQGIYCREELERHIRESLRYRDAYAAALAS